MTELLIDIPKAALNQPKSNPIALTSLNNLPNTKEIEFSAKIGTINRSFMVIIPRHIIAQYPQYLGKGRIVRFKILFGVQK
jgi:hypothetical protein